MTKQKKFITCDGLKKITISGYKSISPDKPVTIELEDINILLGANGSGKSNIISFFKMLNYMMTGSFQLFVAKTGTSQVFLHYGSKRTSAIKGELYFENSTHYDNYTFQLTHVDPDQLIITSEEIVWGEKDRETAQTLRLNTNFKESALINNTNDTIAIIRKILSNCKVYQFHDSSPESPIRQSSSINTANYLQAEGDNLASFLYLLKKEYVSNYNKIVSYIKLIMPQFKDFYLEPNKGGYVMLNWVDISLNDYVLPPQQFSDGTIRFIALATLLLQPATMMPKVIIMDEPELGLHPYAINQLAEMIKEAAKHTQIIVATQSPGLVDEFTANQVTIVERDEEDDCTIVNRLKEEQLEEWLKEYSLSELWDKNVIGGRP
ncbi:Chromosome partition protein Smc [termite gut metagenome]|uniref:Chromosome partition protein Smc n=1 Tax=termite gut metagenome TaxID=433724 RepID=A0A5J4RNC7_9ZZZZ